MIVYAFTKKIKEGKVAHQQIADPGDIAKIGHVLEKLEQLTGVSDIKLEELELRSNPRKWISSLMAGYPHSVSNDEMDNLLSDFTEPMKIRMREESKYAIGLLMQSKLILCHSY